MTVENDDTNPVPVSIVDGENGGQTITEYRLVGVTPTPTTGGISSGPSNGYKAMHELCHSQFTDSRACYASEASGPNTLPPGTPNAWVIRSRDVGFVINPDATNPYEAIDAGSGITVFAGSGRIAISNLDCNQYRLGDSGTTGQRVLIFSGGIESIPCDTPHPIACCAPVEVPIFTPTP